MTGATATLAPSLPRSAVDGVLRVGVAVTLAIDAVVHWRLAGGYGQAFPDGVGGDTIFRLEAVVAVLAAAFVLWGGSRLAYTAAFAVAASALVAVVLYRYVQVPTIGPLPSMYEPVWFTEKAVSAVAEGIGAVLAAVGAATAHRGRRAA